MFSLNLSPKSFYDSNFLSKEEADYYFNLLDKLEGWNKNNYNGYNLNRQTLVFASEEIVNNSIKFKIPEIWGKNVVVLKFPYFMSFLLEKLKLITNVEYNIVLGNRYLKAKDKIAQHSDNEEFGNTQSIASLSFGVPRMFYFKSKNLEAKEDKSLLLEHGSLLFMGENCQENYTHGMKNDKIIEHAIFGKRRINLTFRVWNYI